MRALRAGPMTRESCDGAVMLARRLSRAGAGPRGLPPLFLPARVAVLRRTAVQRVDARRGMQRRQRLELLAMLLASAVVGWLAAGAWR